MRDVVETGLFRLAQPRDAFRAVAIDPLYLVNFLARGFYQIAQKRRLVDFGFDLGFHAEVSGRLLAVALLELLAAAARAWFVTADLRRFATNGHGGKNDFLLRRRCL